MGERKALVGGSSKAALSKQLHRDPVKINYVSCYVIYHMYVMLIYVLVCKDCIIYSFIFLAMLGLRCCVWLW